MAHRNTRTHCNVSSALPRTPSAPKRPASRSVTAALFDQADRHEQTLVEFVAQPNSLTVMPTAEAYGHWQANYSFYNARLFGGKLPNALITLTRHHGVLGYFCEGAFADRSGHIAHEISLNPSYFGSRGDMASDATLVHEMAHLCRSVFGRPNRKGGKGIGGYHDAEWAGIMETVGLMPSDTGGPGGKRTGYHMTHYVIKGGSFDAACAELLADGHTVNWRDTVAAQSAGGGSRGTDDPPVEGGEARKPRNTRTRFVCAICDLRAWSRASPRLRACRGKRTRRSRPPNMRRSPRTAA